MLASVITVTNPFNPASGREFKQYRRPRRLDKIAPKTELPFICVLNGVPLMKDEYRRTIKHGDVAVFVCYPQGGGGGSNPLKIVLMVALSVYAPHAAVGIFGEAAGAVGALTTFGKFAAGAIGFVGTMLINAAFPGPGVPSSNRQQALVSPSPTYNLTAQGNRARPGEPIPDFYGRHLHFPDFAADPYTEYAGNEQYLYQLFCIGQGEYEIEQVRIGDTAIENFPEVEYAFYGPGQRVLLFPSIVFTSQEVVGQEATTNVALGPFPVSTPGVRVRSVAFDMVCTRGLFFANDEGGLNPLSINFRLEVRAIDDNGAPTGDWIVLANLVISAATATPIRRSYRYDVTEGRYEARVTRTNGKNTSSRAGHEIVWAALRGYTPAQNDYGDVTMMAIRARATNNLSSQSSRLVNIVKTRKLETWDGTSWSERVATRNPAWAVINVLRAAYGGRLPLARIDLPSFLARAETWDARGDYFDGGFDGPGTVYEAVNVIARAGRAKIYEQAGIWYCWRHEPQSMPVTMFNMRNIARGSARTEFILPTEQTADAVEITYLDELTWKEKTVLCRLPGGSADNVKQEKLFGVTNQAQAWREGMYMAACNRYQRLPFNFTTEMEGFIPTFGDLISLAHDRGQWGQSGDVLEYDDENLIIRTSQPLDWSAGGTHYFRFRLRDGSFDGPYVATEGADEYHAILADELGFIPDVGMDRERTSYSFGAGQEFGRLALVMKVLPRNLNTVEITTINEDPAIHLADTGATPPASTQWNLPARITRPQVRDLNITLAGTATNPLLQITWQPAAGADFYYVEISYDSGVSWVQVAQPVVSQASIPARRGNVYIRVAGVGLSRGDWAEWIGDPFLAPPPDVSSFLVGVQPDGTREFTWTLPNAPVDLAGYQIRYTEGVSSNWSAMIPLHIGYLTASPFESNQLNAGSYTFAIKAFDDGGVESVNARFIVADLGDPRLAGVLLNVLPRTQGWPGTKTNCNIQSGQLVASNQGSWDDLTTWGDWTQWVDDPFLTISYEHPVIDLGASVPFTPLVDVSANGTVTIEESHSDDDVTYSSWAPVGSLITARYIKVRATNVMASGIGIISNMNIKLTAQSQEEDMNDIDTELLAGSYRIGVGDIRLPIAKSYTLITQVGISLQNVGPGWSWEIIDKDATVGPRIKIYNASNALDDAVIDAFVRGAQ